MIDENDLDALVGIDTLQSMIYPVRRFPRHRRAGRPDQRWGTVLGHVHRSRPRGRRANRYRLCLRTGITLARSAHSAGERGIARRIRSTPLAVVQVGDPGASSRTEPTDKSTSGAW